MRVTLKYVRNQTPQTIEIDYPETTERHIPTALDIILHTRREIDTEFSCRYGCRSRLCGVCTIEINGKPKLACHTKVKDGDVLSPLKTLPQLKDFIVQRDLLNAQVRQFVPPLPPVLVETSPSDAFESLSRCIECYACLDNCPTHLKNRIEFFSKEPYEFGNPYTFLNLRRVYLDPAVTDENRKDILQAIQKLGVSGCVECEKCRCLRGINLGEEVIKPFLALLSQPLYD